MVTILPTRTCFSVELSFLIWRLYISRVSMVAAELSRESRVLITAPNRAANMIPIRPAGSICWIRKG